MQSAREYFDYLNHAYLAVHKAKEDLFWATYMATSDDQAGFARAESAYKEFIARSGQARRRRATQLARVRAAPPSAERDALLHGLGGWLALFEANIIDSPEGRSLMREIVDAEAALFERKRAHEPRHLNEQGRVGGRLAADARDQSGHQSRRRAPAELVRRASAASSAGCSSTGFSSWSACATASPARSATRTTST